MVKSPSSLLSMRTTFPDEERVASQVNLNMVI